MSTIVHIDLNLESNKNIIMKLCKRNNFYEDDVYANLYRDIRIHRKEQMSDKQLISVKKHLNDLFKLKKITAYFCTILKNDVIKVVGFMMYSIGEDAINELTFLLIDKFYQKNGFGSKLLDKYIEDIYIKKILGAYTLIDKKLIKFYQKKGFVLDHSLVEQEICRADGLIKIYYIPKEVEYAIEFVDNFKSISKSLKSSIL